jgi:hypothetical protein
VVRVGVVGNPTFPPLICGDEAEYVARPVHEIAGRHDEEVPARLPLCEPARSLKRNSHQYRTVIPAHQREVIALDEHYSVVVHRSGDWDYRIRFPDR